jgi:hypothetical protein
MEYNVKPYQLIVIPKGTAAIENALHVLVVMEVVFKVTPGADAFSISVFRVTNEEFTRTQNVFNTRLRAMEVTS